MDRQQISDVRRFNRVVTQRIGALQDGSLDRGRPLGEARLLFEIGPAGANVQVLRNGLHLDSGYVSRLLKSLQAQGLISVGRGDGDGRRRRVSLTEAGHVEFAAYDELSDDLAASLLAPLGETQRELMIRAMADVERCIRASTVELNLEPAESKDAIWCLNQYFAELAQRFEEGFDPSRGNPPGEKGKPPLAAAFIVARLDGRPVGCGVLLPNHSGIGEIKRMWISTETRGMGVASRILSRLEELAREFGWTRVRLDTNRALKEAQAMYQKAGYQAIERYNDNPYADHWFEKEL